MTMLGDDAVGRARQALRAGNADTAKKILMANIQQAHIAAHDYDEILRTLADALQQLGELRAAGSVWLYLRDPARMAALVQSEPRDLARAAQLERRHALAAQYYRAARWPAHAAIQYEEARMFPEARALWEEVSADPRLREDPYTAALVSFNLGRVLSQLGDSTGAHRCRVRATRLLEEAADMLEARGLRERAFDCFQVLLTLGVETGSFENLAEGYLNCIRILREDHLKYYALQYYEDFIVRAERAGEHHAVATILHEAADYARGVGLPFHGTLRVREAEGWRRAAQHALAQGASAQFAENALLAAVGAYTNVGMHAQAVAVFRTLAELPGSEEKRTKRYQSLVERYRDAVDEPIRSAPLPDYLRQPVAHPDIWNDDTIEWEEAGDPVETCGEILLDTSHPDYVRRRALIARLIPLTQREPNHPNTLAAIAEALGQVQLYSVLAPLEQLFERGRSDVRVACLRAARQLFFKRTFALVMKGVHAADDPQVLGAALEAISSLHFPHAFDPLSRLHRESDHPRVRQAALGSIGKIPSREAVEYLIGTIVHGTEEERQQARELLVRNDAQEATALIQVAAASERPEVAQVLGAVLRSRLR
jgi:tetratricopeptide (TPR) repeat protein